jgi:hypothetical protein
MLPNGTRGALGMDSGNRHIGTGRCILPWHVDPDSGFTFPCVLLGFELAARMGVPNGVSTMRCRIEETGLPSYGLDAVPDDAGTCYFAERAAQVYDSDLVDFVGAHQRSVAENFAVPGEGASLLFMSGPRDIVLARRIPGNKEAAEFNRKIELLRRHWETCGIPTGQLQFVDDVSVAAKAAADEFYLCSPVFSSQVSAIIDDEHAHKQRQLIATLLNKQHVASLTGDSTVHHVSGQEKLSQLIAMHDTRWVVKAAIGAGGQMMAYGDPRSEVDHILRASAQWGDSIFQTYVEGEEHFAFYLIDPELAGPKLLLEGVSDNTDSPNCANSWSASGDYRVGVTDAAGKIFDLARMRGAAPFVLGQDIRGPSGIVVDNNPRWCAYVPMLRLLSHDAGRVETMKHLRVLASPETVASVLSNLPSFEYDGKNRRGIVLCAAPDRPISALVILIVNDADGQIEQNFLQRFRLKSTLPE